MKPFNQNNQLTIHNWPPFPGPPVCTAPAVSHLDASVQCACLSPEIRQYGCPAPSHLPQCRAIICMGKKQKPGLGNAQAWAVSLFDILTWISATFPQVQTLGHPTSHLHHLQEEEGAHPGSQRSQCVEHLTCPPFSCSSPFRHRTQSEKGETSGMSHI